MEVEELQTENAQLQEDNRHMITEKERERLMEVQADKAQTECFNMETSLAGEEAKPKEPMKTIGRRQSSAVGNDGPPRSTESHPSGFVIHQVNRSPTPSEPGGIPVTMTPLGNMENRSTIRSTSKAGQQLQAFVLGS